MTLNWTYLICIILSWTYRIWIKTKNEKQKTSTLSEHFRLLYVLNIFGFQLNLSYSKYIELKHTTFELL